VFRQRESPDRSSASAAATGPATCPYRRGSGRIPRSGADPVVRGRGDVSHEPCRSRARAVASLVSIQPRDRTDRIESGPSARRNWTRIASGRRALRSVRPVRRASSVRLITRPLDSSSTPSTARSCGPSRIVSAVPSKFVAVMRRPYEGGVSASFVRCEWAVNCGGRPTTERGAFLLARHLTRGSRWGRGPVVPH